MDKYIELKLTKDEAMFLRCALLEAVRVRKYSVKECENEHRVPDKVKSDIIAQHNAYISEYERLDEKIIEAGVS